MNIKWENLLPHNNYEMNPIFKTSAVHIENELAMLHALSLLDRDVTLPPISQELLKL